MEQIRIQSGLLGVVAFAQGTAGRLNKETSMLIPKLLKYDSI